RLRPGTRLPASRALATDLGIARNTVADCYAQLVAEGWLSARQGSGTWVAERVPSPLPAAGAPVPAAAHRVRYDLRTGVPDVSALPRQAWLAAGRKALVAAPARRHSATPTREACRSCAMRWPGTWPAPAVSPSPRTASWSARASPRAWNC